MRELVERELTTIAQCLADKAALGSGDSEDSDCATIDAATIVAQSTTMIAEFEASGGTGLKRSTGNESKQRKDANVAFTDQ